MDANTRETIRILKAEYKHADIRARKYEIGEVKSSILPTPADYWLGYMRGVRFAVTLLTEEEDTNTWE